MHNLIFAVTVTNTK